MPCVDEPTEVLLFAPSLFTLILGHARLRLAAFARPAAPYTNWPQRPQRQRLPCWPRPCRIRPQPHCNTAAPLRRLRHFRYSAAGDTDSPVRSCRSIRLCFRTSARSSKNPIRRIDFRTHFRVEFDWELTDRKNWLGKLALASGEVGTWC